MANEKSFNIKLVIVAIVITALVCFAIFYLYPNYQKNLKIGEYKKAVYDSNLCQYECPLALQNISNKTQLLPNVTCVENCANVFKQKNLDVDGLTNKDLEKDNFAKDIADILNACKKEAINNQTMTLNNSIYFMCVPRGLEALKQKYNYLK